MERLLLTPEDNIVIESVVAGIAEQYSSIEDPELVGRASVLARHLPEHLVQFLDAHRLQERSALCVVAGLEIDQAAIGSTPGHWRNSQIDSQAFEHEIFFLLCATVLGDVFAWATQQDGRIMHDILPVEGHEHYEIGSNSLQHLSWHTEDSFHPCRGDYVALMCLRNPDRVRTLVCDSGDLDWSKLDVDTLFEPVFTQLPDNSHLPENAAEKTGDPVIDRLRRRSFDLIQSWNESPVSRAILYGDKSDPYLALDPYHMDTDSWPDRALSAFKQLCEEIEMRMIGVDLQPGDIAFIDNFKAVHGRESFRARYDGNDRWLKRLNITRNLRGSRAWRRTPEDRVIY